MSFPISIKYSAELSIPCSITKRQELLEYIKHFVLNREAENIKIENDKLTFEGPSYKFFSPLRVTYTLAPVDNGFFTLVDKGDKTTIIYEFYMYQLFIISTFIPLLIGLISERISVGIFYFILLGVPGWLITLIRQKMMLRQIVGELEIFIRR